MKKLQCNVQRNKSKHQHQAAGRQVASQTKAPGLWQRLPLNGTGPQEATGKYTFQFVKIKPENRSSGRE
jgi:hypothetical protein